MRPTGLLPYVEWFIDPRQVGTKIRVYADVWESESFSADTTVTDHPVESGARITDHLILEPIELKCRMFFSAVPIRGDLDPVYHPGGLASYVLNVPPYPNLTPLISPGGLQNAVVGLAGAAVSALGFGGPSGPRSATALQFGSPPGRLQEFLEQLLALRELKTLFTVGASVRRFENMALTSAALARAEEDGDSGALDLSFREVQFVSTQTAAAVPLPKEPRAQPATSGKSGATTPPTPAQKTVGAALVDQFFGAAPAAGGGGFFG